MTDCNFLFLVSLCLRQTCGEPIPTPEPEPVPGPDPGPFYACPPESYEDPDLYGPDGLPTFRPLIIGHRGASGMFPEHTAMAYRNAAEQGADLIECDMAITRVRGKRDRFRAFSDSATLLKI